MAEGAPCCRAWEGWEARMEGREEGRSEEEEEEECWEG